MNNERNADLPTKSYSRNLLHLFLIITTNKIKWLFNAVRLKPPKLPSLYKIIFCTFCKYILTVIPPSPNHLLPIMDTTANWDGFDFLEDCASNQRASFRGWRKVNAIPISNKEKKAVFEKLRKWMHNRIFWPHLSERFFYGRTCEQRIEVNVSSYMDLGQIRIKRGKEWARKRNEK